jgi:hypothetical protein
MSEPFWQRVLAMEEAKASAAIEGHETELTAVQLVLLEDGWTYDQVMAATKPQEEDNE